MCHSRLPGILNLDFRWLLVLGPTEDEGPNGCELPVLASQARERPGIAPSLGPPGTRIAAVYCIWRRAPGLPVPEQLNRSLIAVSPVSS